MNRLIKVLYTFFCLTTISYVVSVSTYETKKECEKNIKKITKEQGRSECIKKKNDQYYMVVPRETFSALVKEDTTSPVADDLIED